MWRIGWVQHQLVTDPRHLFDANIFYPLRATLTYSDAMILIRLYIRLPFRFSRSASPRVSACWSC